jgi:hypothetical protein
MQAWKVKFTSGQEGFGYQIMWGGTTVRIADEKGVTVQPPFEYETIDTNPTKPDWLDPDPTPEEPPPPAPQEHRYIAKAAFWRRATLPEKLALEMASLDNPQATMEQRMFAATIRVWRMEEANMKAFDLADEETRKGIQNLEAFAILSPGRAAELLDSPIQPDEEPNGV